MPAGVYQNFHATILIIDDRENMLRMLSHHMRRYGFIIYTAKTVQRAEAVAREKRPSIIILADVLEGVSTLPLCSLLHQLKGATPLILLSTLTSNEDIAALPAGMITETIKLPLAPPAIVAQIRTVYRIHRPSLASKIMVLDDLVMHLTSFKITKGGRELNVSPVEFKILQCLMASPNRIISREAILDYVWGNQKVLSHVRTIDVHIMRLRATLKEAEMNLQDSIPSTIQTIRNQGYCLNQQDA
jgi:two-component system phosphate regulon response regulator PhoB